MSGALALLHGFTGSPASWDRVLAWLRLRGPVLRPPLLGHGPGAGTGVTSFEQEVDRLAGQIRAAAGGPAHLAGYSLGGRLVLGLLCRHPDLVRSAVVIAAHPGLRDDHERARRRGWDDDWARLLEAEGLDAFVRSWEALPLFGTQARLPETVRVRRRTERRSHAPAGLARAMRVLGLGRMPDLRPDLERVTAPVRLVVGSEDGRFRRLAGETATALARAPAEVHVVEGAGHDVVLERPAQVAAVIGRAFAGPQAEGGVHERAASI